MKRRSFLIGACSLASIPLIERVELIAKPLFFDMGAHCHTKEFLYLFGESAPCLSELLQIDEFETHYSEVFKQFQFESTFTALYIVK